MAKLNFTLYGKDYTINCDSGEEPRLKELVRFIETKMREVASRAGNTTEPRLLMLTCLHLADALFDARRKAEEAAVANEDVLVAAVEHLTQRITHIASQVGHA